MTKEQFEGWFVDVFAVHFPATIQWIEGLRDAVKVTAAWYDIAFSGFTVPEATAACHLITRGKYGYEKYRWQDTPSIFSGIVRDIRLAAATMQERQSTEEFNESSRGAMSFVKNDATMGPAYTRAREIIQEERDAGKSLHEAVAIMKTTRRREWCDILGPMDDTSGRRFKCRTCKDSGLIEVWAHRAMAQARAVYKAKLDLRGPDGERVTWSVEHCACDDCDEGDKWATKKDRHGNESGYCMRYDPEKFVRCTGDAASDRESLWKWAEEHEPLPANDFGEYSGEF